MSSAVWTDERKELALAEAQRWLGAPYARRGSSLEGGVDCILYVANIMFAAGVFEPARFAPYEPTLGLYKESTKLERELLRIAHCVLLDPRKSEPEFGDIAVMRTGDRSAHCGFVAGRHLYHSLAGRSVVRSEWSLWRGRVRRLCRILSTGWREDPASNGGAR